MLESVGVKMSNKNYYETDKYVFFYGSFYSQWAMRSMVIDGETYNCCEQFMMTEKAKLFNDLESVNKIRSVSDPATQKSLGRKVKNFNKDKWEEVARDVVFKANYAKFTQHEDLMKKLLATGDKIIVEASPWDRIWGIGMRASDPGITDPKNWRGTNWLGEAIMAVRKVLMKEDVERQLKETCKDPNYTFGA